MAIDPLHLLYGAVFLSALLLIEGLYYLFIDSALSTRRVNRRLSLLGSGMDGREVLELLRRQPATDRDFLGPLAKPIAAFESLVSQSGLPIKPLRVVTIMAALALLTFVGLRVGLSLGRLPGFMTALPVQGMLSLLIGIGLPLLYLSAKRSRRVRKFAEQLPDALDIMVRSLRAGHPINAAMGLVAKEMADPMGTEFGIAIDEMTYGLDLREALANLGERIHVDDFKYVVVSINIQHETGGNLAEVLSNLSSVIRDRARMFLKVRSLSGEGRISAMVLCTLPFATGGFLLTFNPEFYTAVVDDPLFLPILSVAIFDLVMGVLVIYRMVNFRV